MTRGCQAVRRSQPSSTTSRDSASSTDSGSKRRVAGSCGAALADVVRRVLVSALDRARGNSRKLAWRSVAIPVLASLYLAENTLKRFPSIESRNRGRLDVRLSFKFKACWAWRIVSSETPHRAITEGTSEKFAWVRLNRWCLRWLRPGVVAAASAAVRNMAISVEATDTGLCSWLLRCRAEALAASKTSHICLLPAVAATSRGQVPCQSPSHGSTWAASRRCTTRVSPSATATISGGFPVSRSPRQRGATFMHFSTRWIRSLFPVELCSMYKSSPFPVSSTALGSACFRSRNWTTRKDPVLAKSRLDGSGLLYTALSSFISLSISIAAFSERTRHC
mmetsp:Transcript_19183/g.42555  ORF Transcript_19183/g.42555 Transcript_19183/m.42555 type:complete len:336 (+) Transcript_19183:993-2000(+)